MPPGSTVGLGSKVIKLDFPRDASGSYMAGSGGTVSASVGDEIRVAFQAPSGMGPADLKTTVQGTSVAFIKNDRVGRYSGSKQLIGASEIDSVLSAPAAGKSTVKVDLLDASGKLTETINFTVDVT